MKQTVAGIVLFVLGFALGSSFAPAPAQAQAQAGPPWLKTGTRVTLVYVDSTTAVCEINEIRDTFVKCGSGPHWFNLATAKVVIQ